MSKDKSLELKGIALIMMLWCHFFITGDQYELYYLCKWGDFNLFGFLSRACTPVVLFVILSGYGLYCVYEKGDRHRYSRILKLFIHYWVITLIFITIAHFFTDIEKYPGNIKNIILNLTAFKTTWNRECWFLFPYSILALCYPLIFKFMKNNELLVSVISLIMFFVSGFLISRFGKGGSISNPFINNIVQTGFMLLPLIIGAFSSKYNIFTKLKNNFQSKTNKWIFLLLIILLIIIKCFISSSVFNPIYGFLFISLYLLICSNNKFIILRFIGKHSMNIWMIHTWLMVYIFSDYFYSLKEPVLILSAVLIIGLLISMLINLFIEQLLSALNKQ